MERFQSLLYWISHCGVIDIFGALVHRRFQSLLYWISHCGPVGAVTWADSRICFNPCCIGLAIAAPETVAQLAAAYEFQSLLYWISHCGFSDSSGRPVAGCVSILVVLD